MIKAIIFDVGGTLLGATDLLENVLACNAGIQSHDDIYKQLGNEFFKQIAGCRTGAPFKKVAEALTEAIAVVNKANNNCLASANAEQVYWKTFVNDSFVINDADVALEKLNAKNIELIIASDADAELLYAQFEQRGWNQYISKWFLSSKIKAYKPGAAFVSALNTAISNYQKGEVLFVGDSDVDIETGKKLGVKTVLIGRNNQKRYDEDYSITSLLQLLDL